MDALESQYAASLDFGGMSTDEVRFSNLQMHLSTVYTNLYFTEMIYIRICYHGIILCYHDNAMRLLRLY